MVGGGTAGRPSPFAARPPAVAIVGIFRRGDAASLSLSAEKRSNESQFAALPFTYAIRDVLVCEDIIQENQARKSATVQNGSKAMVCLHMRAQGEEEKVSRLGMETQCHGMGHVCVCVTL